MNVCNLNVVGDGVPLEFKMYIHIHVDDIVFRFALEIGLRRIADSV